MEKGTNIKDKIVATAKKIFQYFKANPFVTSLVCFALVVLVLILVAMFALHEYVISVCVLIILEAMMAVLLQKSELWKHAVLVVAQIVAGVIIGRIPLIIICVLAYIAAMVTLHFMFKKSKNSPKEQSLGLFLLQIQNRGFYE